MLCPVSLCFLLKIDQMELNNEKSIRFKQALNQWLMLTDPANTMNRLYMQETGCTRNK